MYSFSVRGVKQNKHDQIEEDGGWLSFLRFSRTAAEAQSNTWGVRFANRNQKNYVFKKTKHLSGNTKTNACTYFCNSNFILKFHSNYADHITLMWSHLHLTLKGSFTFMLTHISIYYTLCVRVRVVYRSALIDFDESAPLRAQHYDKALSSFWLSLPKSFLR